MKNLIFRAALTFFLFACGTRAEHHRTEAAESPAGINTDSLKKAAERKAFYASRAQQFTDSLLGRGHFNGSVLVAKDGQVLFEKYYGYANPRVRKDSLTEHSPTHLASVSKTLTAAAILKLWQDGKLDIHDPVSKYLPQFPSPDVTIKTLLNHRSGLPNYVHFMDQLGWNRSRFVTNQDVLQFLIDHRKQIAIGPADRHFSYSNTNYALLALIIEKVSGLPYPRFMQQEVFKPLGMNDTYVFTAADSARSIGSYYYSGRPYPFDFLDYVYGDKNIYSTVRDLFAFDQALEQGSFLRKDIQDSAYTPYSFEKPGIHNYGLGWRMYDRKNGKKLIYHNGWWHGNRTAFVRMQDEDAVIIALCNNDYKQVYKINRLASLFGDYWPGSGNPSIHDDDPEDNETTQAAPQPKASLPVVASSTQKKIRHHHRVTAKK